MRSKRYIKIIGLLIYTILIAGIVFLIVNPNNNNSSSAEDEKKKPISVSENINDEDYSWIPLPEIDLENPGGVYELNSLTSEAKNTIDLRTLSDHEVQINGEDFSGKESYTFNIDSINEENHIELTIDGEEYLIKTLPETLSNYDYENNGAEDGFYYFTYDSYIVKLSTDGEIVYYNDVGFPFNFTMHKTEDGNKYYCYGFRTNTNNKIDEIGYQPVKAVIMDESYKIVDEVESILPTDKLNVNPLDSHEFIFIDLGHYIVSSYYPEEVFNIPSEIKQNKFGANVVSAVIQEIKDNEVLFEWNSTDHPELYDLSVEHNDFTNEHSNYADYFHFNSIAIDPEDDNLIVSARNMDTIFKIDRETGEIHWKLGGKEDEFGLDEEQKFKRQHKLSFLSDGTILLFNNGNILPKGPYPIIPEDSPLMDETAETSIMKIKIDEDKKEILDYENFLTGEFSGTRGSAQMINEKENNVMIGWGSRENNDAVFTEMNFSTGEEVFVFYPNNDDIISYRSYKFNE